jgi:hypothetical protein
MTANKLTTNLIGDLVHQFQRANFGQKPSFVIVSIVAFKNLIDIVFSDRSYTAMYYQVNRKLILFGVQVISSPDMENDQIEVVTNQQPKPPIAIVSENDKVEFFAIKRQQP